MMRASDAGAALFPRNGRLSLIDLLTGVTGVAVTALACSTMDGADATKSVEMFDSEEALTTVADEDTDTTLSGVVICLGVQLLSFALCLVCSATRLNNC